MRCYFRDIGFERETVQTADRIEIFPDLSVPTASAEAIVAMKVLSATPQRPRDFGDIQAVLRVNPTLDEGWVVSLLELISTRGYSRGQDLVESGANCESNWVSEAFTLCATHASRCACKELKSCSSPAEVDLRV